MRAAAVRATTTALDALPDGITSVSLRDWPDDFPTDMAIVRRIPHESRADPVMYRRVRAV